MATMKIPESGAILRGAPDTEIGASKPQTQVVQAMRLNLNEEIVSELARCSRSGKPIKLSFGKSPTLRYGTKTLDLAASAEQFRNELYTSVSSDTTKELTFAGLISHRLELPKAEEVTAGADAAMLALQSQMAALQEEKQSKKTLFVKDGSSLPPAKSGKRPPLKSSKLPAFLKAPPRLLNNGTTRSMPASPSLSASRSPSHNPSHQSLTSAPLPQSAKAAKMQALRMPLIHLLATRPASEQALAKQTRSSTADVLELLQKFGKPSRVNDTWELTDRAFKELDVWKFPFPSQQVRQAAIDNAISAYDRMRLGRDDKLWQLLLPAAERGKGKVLSKLHLHAGPISKTATPKLQAQRPEESKAGGTSSKPSEERVDRQPTNGASHAKVAEPMVRSASQDPIKKKKVSEKEALSKRLLSKNPPKAARPVTKPKEVEAPEKVQPSKTGTKVKSAEFVTESDEEIDFGDVQPEKEAPAPEPARKNPSKAQRPVADKKENERKEKPQAKEAAKGTKQASKLSQPARANGASKPEAKPISKPNAKPNTKPAARKAPASAPAPAPASAASNVTSPQKLSESSQSSSSSGSLHSRNGYTRRKSNTYPSKPSPLGSSPPTNASDFENANEASNGTTSSSSSSSSPLMASREITQLAARKSAAAATDPTKNSDSKLKRKANDIESGIHDHTTAREVARGEQKKRHQPQHINSPNSDSSSSVTPPPSNYETLRLAQRFKEYYAKYAKLYQELLVSANPPADKVKQVTEMHHRLSAMKMEITRAASSP
ncbi:hypothetical protein L228DRAFT_266690 [Xylona heveae TC161]|uniref:RNA polymerase II elongation factor ELL N-terminal domain-containing protein n=1 Tax=Xylona heveae (strain CBS 132557 / TC161) TaxID=1328760 RepID=A0A165I3X9_XYLHT|nr:hypothetical protein L228DRAFT_266690 [Xylona heveae TC161]KZF24345.1 hypothetical protein L228DRAFT_266690 [Xylona heveae TC161]